MSNNIENITIIGLGLIGGSIAKALRRFLPDMRLTGVDFPEVVAQGLELQVIDRGFETGQAGEACRDADLVFVATPIGQTLTVLQGILPELQPGTIVTDVGSLKSQLRLAVDRLIPAEQEVYFIGGHPMAGAEKPGLQHADAFLFENALYALTPPPFVPEHAVRQLADIINALGAHVVLLDADLHDRVAAAVSHLPQLLAVALMNFVAQKHRDNPIYLKMAAGGFRDMTRIASSPYSIWRDICDGNRDKILQELDEFIDALQGLRGKLATGDLQAEFDRAARNRLSIPKDTRGFLQPLYDLSVEVEDRPGVIASISAALAEAEINIKDIEVLKVRENEGGTIRLAFESAPVRRRARALLQEIGFVCQERAG